MDSFSNFCIKQQELNEALVTFGKKAYPKFNQVVIMAGGAGSGKGFVQSKLMGIEGITLDVDRVKELAMRSESLSARIKKETGHDITKFNLKNPDEVRKLHELLSVEFKVTKAVDKKVFTGILAAPADRKPNLIFDVTLAGMSKMAGVIDKINTLGYEKKNIHIVWVMNDINVAIEQNAARSRTVPIDILVSTHTGAAMTFKNLLATGEGARSWSDGDWWIVFNKIGVDSKISKSESGGSYVVDANYIKVKEQGKAPSKASDLDVAIVKKIAKYAPNDNTWNMLKK